MLFKGQTHSFIPELPFLYFSIKASATLLLSNRQHSQSNPRGRVHWEQIHEASETRLSAEQLWKSNTEFGSQRNASQRNFTFIAVSDCVEIDVVLIVGEEEKAEPGVKGVDGNDEEDAHYVSLLVWRTVVTQMHVDLKEGGENTAIQISLVS